VTLRAEPITLRDANAFVARHHRHNKPTQGCKFAVAAWRGRELQGVAIVGRPVSRMLQRDPFVAEVLRCCVLPTAARNTCSFLYGRCCRIWREMGGERLVTYTLEEEHGTSLRAAGFVWRYKTDAGKGWGRRDRPRHPLQVDGKRKIMWEKEVAA